MAKTKFLSRVLAVLMALSMLCSTGVFADYGTGDLESAAEGPIVTSTLTLNNRVNLFTATTAETAKWADVKEGIEIDIAGTVEGATGGYVTYHLVEKDALKAVPLVVEAVEAATLAVGTLSVDTDGSFSGTITVDPQYAANLAKDKTYEFRYAYSTTESTGTWVYVRYIKTFDWADADQKATRTIEKFGFANGITIEIEGNPIRSDAIKVVEDAQTSSNAKAQRQRERESVTHIRTADLKTGDPFQFSSSDYIPDDFSWPGETGKAHTTSTGRRKMFVDVGENLLGGVVLAHGESEQGKYFAENSQTGNAVYRFKANAGGKVLLLSSGTFDACNGWTQKTASGNVSYYDTAINGVLYTTRAVTLEDVQTMDSTATELTATNIYSYLQSHTELYVTAADARNGSKVAAGWYHGPEKNGTAVKSTTYNGLNEGAYIAPDGYFMLPEKNIVNGEWQMETTNKPYSTGLYDDYGYTSGRGWIDQPKNIKYTYERTFEAGDWVEIPYDNSTATADIFSAAVIQFDVPVPQLASASVTSTLDTVFAFAGTAADEATKIEGGTQEVEFAADATEYVVTVPYGTASATATITNALGGTGTASVNLTGVTSKTETVTVGDFEYDVTFKWDDTYPYIYNVKFNHFSYPARNIVMRAAQDKYTFASSTSGNIAASTTTIASRTDYAFANAGKANSELVIDGEAIPNNEYLTVITPSYSDAFYRLQQASHTSNFHMAARVEKPDWITFTASAPGSVYITATHANATEEGFVWDEAAAGVWTKVESATLRGKAVTVFKKSFNTGDTVNVPTQMIKQAEIDYVNAKLQAKFPADNGDYQFKYVLGSGGIALLNYSNDGKAYDAADKDWTQIEKNLSAQTVGTHKVVGDYVRGYENGSVGSYGNANFALAVAFDQPLSLGEVTYAVDGGDADAITFAEGEFTKNIELPYDTTTVSIEATKAGTGTVTVSPAELNFTSTKTATATVTLTPPTGDPIVYTINFEKGDPKISWESALALTGSPATQTSTIANLYGTTGSIYGGGIYKVAAQSGSINLAATEVDLEVAYGTEAVVLNGEVKINLLDNNGTGTGTITINGTEYTVNVSWKAFDAAAMSEDAPLLYDLQYHVADKSNLAGGGTWYYAMPTRLTLDAEHDWEYGTVDLDGAEYVYKNNTYNSHYKAYAWITVNSHDNTNYTVTNNGANIARLRIAGESFASWVETGDLKDKYALDGATLLVPHYADAAANTVVSPRYTFKSAVKGYVIAAFSKSQGTTLTDAGWERLSDVEVVTSNKSDGGIEGSLQAGGAPVTSIGTIGTAYGYIYIKQVNVGDTVEVLESAVASQVPPIVIVATEDMIQERVLKLNSLSYTTALAISGTIANPSAANAPLFTNGFYKQALVTEAQTVEVAEDATTVTVTVPYGSEIVNLAGVDSDEGAVTFDAINLINNNGAFTVKKTVGEIEYTINVKWADYVAANDAAGNYVYDVQYGLKDLANSTFYNIVPSKIAITENRIAAQSIPMYADASGKPLKAAGEWYVSADINGAKTNLLVFGDSGADIQRARLSTIAFEDWVKSGLITASGIPAAPNAEDVDTDAEVDAIAYAAMNGATTFVAHYQDFSAATSVEGPHISFKVAQDSIVYVSTTSTNIGEGWTAYNAGALNRHNRTNDYYYTTEDGVTYTQSSVKQYCTDGYGFVGSNAFYRYAKAGDTVSVTVNANNSNVIPAVFVRPIDFSDFEAPTMGEITYTIGSGEATVVEFAEGETTATVPVPWGTTDAIALQTAITSGQGNIAISDALTLSKETSEGTITVAVTDVLGNEVGAYTVNFVWGAAPEVEAITYSTARTLYKGAVEKDAVLGDETEITVPWGTASVTVSYKLEGAAEAVKLDAVNFVDGTASVEVELPEETKTYTFTYDDAPTGQYVEIIQYAQKELWKDRMFVSYGDVDNAFTEGATKYATSGAVFFADDDEYSYRLPDGVAKKGYTAVIADAGANKGMEHMELSSFYYMANSYPAIAGDGSDAWMSFTVAKTGKVYAAAPQYDEVWEELDNLGWTEAPFRMTWGSATRKVYQRDVVAGETVYMPGAQLLQREIDAYNEGREDYIYVKATADDIAAIEAAVEERIAAGELQAGSFVSTAVKEGEYLRKYLDPNADAGKIKIGSLETNRNFAGFYLHAVGINNTKELQFGHYVRANNTVLFVVAEEFVAAEAKAPQYTGAETMTANGAIELSANPAYYAAAKGGEITFAIKGGSSEYATLNGTTLTATTANYVAGASVTIVVTQTYENGDTLTSEVEIPIMPAVFTPDNGSLTINEPSGLGTFTAVVDGEEVNDGSIVDEAVEIALGKTVTLTATADENYEFAYWARVDSNGEIVYNTNASFDLAMPYSITLKPVFKYVNPEVPSYTVTFVGYQGKIVDTYDTNSVEKIVVPAAQNVFGYTFAGYYEAEDWNREELTVDAELNKELFNKDVTFTAAYTKDDTSYTLTVEGGTVNGAETAQVAYNEAVTVVANPDTEGSVFSHWTDEKGQILSYARDYRFYMAAADRKVIAVFAEVAAAARPVVTMTVAKTGGDAKGLIFGMFAERRVPTDLTVVESGIIYGAEGYLGFTDIVATDDVLTDDLNIENTYVGKKTSSYQNNNGQYTVRIQMTETRKAKGYNWYARTYLIYRDTDGSLKTAYSDTVLIYSYPAE